MIATVFKANYDVAATLGECPTWIASARQLAFIDAGEARYYLLDPLTGAVACRALPTPITAAAPLSAGSAVLALQKGIALLDGSVLSPMPSPNMTNLHFNDGKCDPAGRFWIGSRAADGLPGRGALFRSDGLTDPVRVDGGFDVCNGLGWSPDARHFYLIDTPPRRLYRYAFDLTTGMLSNRILLSDFAGVAGRPDGMAVDAAGRLWVAMWDGGGIAVLSPAGVMIDWIETPAPRPTSCAFGGTDLRTLFVTTASIGLDPRDRDFGRSGAVLSYRVDTPGLPVAMYDQAVGAVVH